MLLPGGSACNFDDKVCTTVEIQASSFAIEKIVSSVSTASEELKPVKMLHIVIDPEVWNKDNLMKGK